MNGGLKFPSLMHCTLRREEREKEKREKRLKRKRFSFGLL
jgi:hypothetical protein